MSKKITFNIPNDCELSSIFNNIDKATTPLDINVNIESKKRSFEDSENVYPPCFSNNKKLKSNQNESAGHINRKNGRFCKSNRNVDQDNEIEIIPTTPSLEKSNLEETINGLTHSQIYNEFDKQLKQSLNELLNDPTEYSEITLLNSLNENSIQEIADYLDNEIIVVNECHILPPNVKNVETIGRFNYIRLKDSKLLKLNLVYWYLHNDNKNHILYNTLKKTCRNRCANSYCLNPEHIICETKRKANPRSLCFKNNSTLLEKFNQEYQRLKDNGDYNPDSARESISKLKCTHRIKCIGEFIE